MKQPNPKNQPILKDIHVPFLQFEIKKINNNGNVMKFKKKKLYGGKLYEVIKPNTKGIIKEKILFCRNNVNLFMEII